MRGFLRVMIPFFILIALAIYCALPHPTHDQAELKAIAAESQRLMAAYPVSPSQQWTQIPKDKWPPAIGSFEPFSVFVGPGTVDITTRPFFDGGWGYGFALRKQDLPMLEECWSALGQGVYWHGPC